MLWLTKDCTFQFQPHASGVVAGFILVGSHYPFCIKIQLASAFSPLHFMALITEKSMVSHVESPTPLLLLAAVVSLLRVSASGQYAIVTFVMVQHAEMGQLFKIIGNSEKLGNWTPGNVENMTWTPGYAWVSSTVLTKGLRYEYKAVVVSFRNAGYAECYTPGNNRVLTLPEDYPKSHYMETVFWKASCGYDCHSTTACAVTNE